MQPSPLEAVARSTVPVLLIHGEDDRNIAPRHSRLIAAAAPNTSGFGLCHMRVTPWHGLPPTVNLKTGFSAGLLHIASHRIRLSIQRQSLPSDFSVVLRTVIHFLGCFCTCNCADSQKNLRIRNRLSSSNFPAALVVSCGPVFFTARMLVPGCFARSRLAE